MPEQIGLIANILFLAVLYFFIWTITKYSFNFALNLRKNKKNFTETENENKTDKTSAPVFKDIKSGTIHKLTHDVMLIGRSANCHIRIFDGFASQHHATLKKVGFAWLLEDEGSTNGTFVNGKKINKKVYLNYGDTIIFGRARFIFEKG